MIGYWADVFALCEFNFLFLSEKSKDGHFEIVKLLVENGKDITTHSDELLHKAASVWNLLFYLYIRRWLLLLLLLFFFLKNRVGTLNWSIFFCKKERTFVISEQFFLLLVEYVFFVFFFIFVCCHFFFEKIKIKHSKGWQFGNCQAVPWDGRRPYWFIQWFCRFSSLQGILRMNYRVLCNSN